jgi:hypothetical protein
MEPKVSRLVACVVVVFWSSALSHFCYSFVVAKMGRNCRIEEFFDYTFGDETWVRAHPGVMSVGTARFLREAFTRF